MPLETTQRTYRVAEFAKLAGVTVRTLHHYDRIGLLAPSDATDGGHRLYTQADLLRMTQILALKWMGFALADIGTMLDAPHHDLQASLIAQQAAVDVQITRLTRVRAALDRAMDALSGSEDGVLDVDTVEGMLYGWSQHDAETELLRQYYSETAWQGIVSRGLSLTPEGLEQAQRDWEDVYRRFRELHSVYPPDAPAVQLVAAKMHRLLDAFTGGDPEAADGLRRLNRDALADELPPGYAGPTPFQGVSDDLRQFMQDALTIYREKRGKQS